MLARDSADGWWVAAQNIPSSTSCPLHDGVWPVQQPEPWPPIIGARLLIQALPVPWSDPRRLPGGGKYTSPVVRVTSG